MRSTCRAALSRAAVTGREQEKRLPDLIRKVHETFIFHAEHSPSYSIYKSLMAVLLDVRDQLREQVGLDVESGHREDIIGRFDLGSRPGNRHGNLMVARVRCHHPGGRKFARHYFVACHTSERGAPYTTARFAPSSWLRCWE